MPDLSLQSQAALSHEDRGPLLLGVSWGLTGLATVFLALRLYCKYLSKRRLWCDDYILIAAWVCCYLTAHALPSASAVADLKCPVQAMILIDDILTVFLVREFGLGRHSWDLQVRDPVRFELLLSSRATVTITAIVWTKSAFAVTLLRLTAGRTRAFVWFILVTVNIAMGVSALVPWIQCRPLAKTWDKTLPGTCWAPGVGVNIWIPTGGTFGLPPRKYETASRWQANNNASSLPAYSAAVDFVLAALPWTFLWKLRMRKREKLGILIAMSMGVL